MLLFCSSKRNECDIKQVPCYSVWGPGQSDQQDWAFLHRSFDLVRGRLQMFSKQHQYLLFFKTWDLRTGEITEIRTL